MKSTRCLVADRRLRDEIDSKHQPLYTICDLNFEMLLPLADVCPYDEERFMPITIYRTATEDQETNTSVAWLCDGEWEITPQIDALSQWLEAAGKDLPPGEYVADVGFCWRRDAAGGGAALEPAAMKRMAEVGMSLYLSEYAGFSDEVEKQ